MALSLEELDAEVTKTPDEVFNFSLDFTPKLPAGATLDAAGHTLVVRDVDTEADTSGTVVTTTTISVDQTLNLATVALASGVAASRHRLDLQMEVNTGAATIEGRILLRII